MKNKLGLKVTTVMIAGLASSFAIAQNQDVKLSPSLVSVSKGVSGKTDVSLSQGVVAYVGSQPSDLKNISGYGKDMPLITVLKQITPAGWVVKKDNSAGSINLDKSVSWKGGSTWNNVLANVCAESNVNAIVDWDKKSITLSNATAKVTTKKSVFELEGSSPQSNKIVEEVVVKETIKPIVETKKPTEVKETIVVKETPNTDIIVDQKIEEIKVVQPSGKTKVEEKIETKVVEIKQEPQIKEPQTYTYQLNGTKSLKENVAIWAAKAGYKLVWTGEDYPVSDGQMVAGAFDADNGPIESLSVDYGLESRAQVPLSFVFYKNKTLVVENVKYEQSGFPQFSKK